MIVSLTQTASQPQAQRQQAQALRNLAFIRETMENAGAFTTIPGWGMVCIGISALATSAVTFQVSTVEAWIGLWFAEAVIACSIGMAAVCHKNKSLGLSLLRGIGLRFLINLSLPILAAVPLTYIFWTNELNVYLPGMWLLLYGTSIITAGSYSIRMVLVMGACFFMLGCIGLVTTFLSNDILMAAGFGGLHLLFGFIVVWKQRATRTGKHEREEESI